MLINLETLKMRIISGKFKGQKLVDCSKMIGLRPTTDWSREALFNILQSGKFLKNTEFNLQGCNFLDACCGTGAVGIEAISRGARKSIFVDNNIEHLQILKKNIANFKIENQTHIIHRDINSLTKIDDEFDAVFLDPPYDSNYQKMVRNLIKNQIITKKTILIIEFETKDLQKFREILNKDFLTLEERKYGRSFLGIYQILSEFSPQIL
ncbi:MAG: 16S rRNA (guanine(966)-N(2))-methyltransferase RsmD [Alphaproteobacteria bacterium]|nr:16S rRNA (guanine(966)-N(2))-methyltransferase RsmD [Alphaproteobacteria bacterium]